LQLDRFWSDRLPRSRKGTRWDQVLQVLACYRTVRTAFLEHRRQHISVEPVNAKCPRKGQ
jgi:hypothetical protein